MATASVTNTFFQDGTTSAADMNQNFTDVETFMNSSVLHLDGTNQMTGNLDLDNNFLTNVGTPIASSDAATKSYVDAYVGGVEIQIANLPFTSAGEGVLTVGSVTNDLLGWYDAEVSTTILTCPQSGIYLFHIYEKCNFGSNGANTNPYIEGDTGTGSFYRHEGWQQGWGETVGVERLNYKTGFIYLDADQRLRFQTGTGGVGMIDLTIRITQMGGY